MLQLAVVLPTLNERDNLAPLVARLEAALEGITWETIVVDDDSADGTAQAARALALADPRVRVIQRIGRRGLASAALEGMLATAAPYVAVMDADHQHDPALLPAMLAAVDGGATDIAIASRFAPGASTEAWARPERERRSALANRLARALTGAELSDPMSGYFLLSAERARTLAPRLSGIGFKILLDILGASPERLRVREFPLAFAARAAGESKLDRVIAFEYVVALYDRYLGRIFPTRFALFGTIGASGIAIHMAVLTALFRGLGWGFAPAQTAAALVAMSFNFVLNNALTYADKRLSGAAALIRGWLGFCATCAVGAVANVAVAGMLVGRSVHWVLAALAGIVVGAVWNYALSSRFVWGRY
ncbi:MAG TPA: glycosyltransferase family 2 protein [Novosphingobium sp.]|nr:glycosyltransferase family 2 protein [Novosphingobium sp.]